jgi:hypothetical protein
MVGDNATTTRRRGLGDARRRGDAGRRPGGLVTLRRGHVAGGIDGWPGWCGHPALGPADGSNQMGVGCWLGFLAWSALTAVLGVDRVHAWTGSPQRHFGVITWALCAVLFFSGHGLHDDGDARLVVGAAALAAGLAGGWVVADEFGWHPIRVAGGDRLLGSMGSAAFLGAATALLLPVALAWPWIGHGAGPCASPRAAVRPLRPGIDRIGSAGGLGRRRAGGRGGGARSASHHRGPPGPADHGRAAGPPPIRGDSMSDIDNIIETSYSPNHETSRSRRATGRR